MSNHTHYIINNDIILEQIIRYRLDIEEIKKTIKQTDPISEFNFAITPPGPHFFTGILQTNNYNSYQKNSTKKNIALIFLQNTEKNKSNQDKILLLKGKIGPILGYTREESNLISFFKKQYDFTKTISKTKTSEQKILEQLPFIRILSETKEILTMFIGKNTDPKNMIKIIDKIFSTHTIFFVTKLHNSLPELECKQKDQKLINQIINKKLTKTNQLKFPLISIFIEICKKFNKNPQSIAYINSGNITENSNQTSGYANIIA